MTVHAMRRLWIAGLAAALCGVVAQAAPPDKLLQQAGPAPSEAQATAAIVAYFRSTNRALNASKPFKLLSGPTLVTGNTFAGGIEQAWLMCLVINAERTGPGPTDLEGKALYLRNRGGKVTVDSTENWKESSPQC
jgi:hypothetical protein